MSQIACELYARNDSEGAEERMVGFQTLRENNSLEPSQYVLVEFRRTVLNSGATRGWTEKQLYGPFYATGLDAIPISAKERKAAHVSQLLSQGYSFLSKVLVNAEARTVERSQREAAPPDLVASGASLNWLLTPPSDKEAIALLKGFIAGIFSQGAVELGFSMSRSENPSGLLPRTLMCVQGQFELRAEGGMGENTLDPVSLEGAGELKPHHGHKPLLMMVYLQQRLVEEFKLATNEGLAFADEQGQTFKYARFDSLEPLIARFGFNYGAVRKDAERLGLASSIIRLAEIEAEAEDCFF